MSSDRHRSDHSSTDRTDERGASGSEGSSRAQEEVNQHRQSNGNGGSSSESDTSSHSHLPSVELVDGNSGHGGARSSAERTADKGSADHDQPGQPDQQGKTAEKQVQQDLSADPSNPGAGEQQASQVLLRLQKSESHNPDGSQQFQTDLNYIDYLLAATGLPTYVNGQWEQPASDAPPPPPPPPVQTSDSASSASSSPGYSLDASYGTGSAGGSSGSAGGDGAGAGSQGGSTSGSPGSAAPLESGATTSGSGPGEIPANAMAIYQYLISQGLSPNAAAGMLGNIASESGGNPDAIEDPSNPMSGGLGLIQWTGQSNEQQIMSSITGNASADLQAQLPLVMQYINQNGGIAALNANSSTPQAAAAYIEQNLERPASLSDEGTREQSAALVAQAAQQGNWASAGALA